MQDATQGISVILPNYNGRGLLERNLPSIFTALENCSVAYQVIVVDDCSSDDSVSFLQREYPQVEVVCNETNRGFSATCNRGIYAATLPLVCVVNTDVTFSPDYFQLALPHFTDPKLFSVKGAIINYRETFTDVVNTEATSELYFKRGFLRFNQRVAPQPEKLNGEINGQFTLLGCCFICQREMMLQLHGFDEVYSPFYWEDADLALRALRRGFSQAYEPRCTVYHQTSATIATHRSNIQRRLVSTRNKFIFTWRHLHGFNNWSRHIGFTLLSLLGRWIILDWKFYTCLAMATYRYHTYPKQSPLEENE